MILEDWVSVYRLKKCYPVIQLSQQPLQKLIRKRFLSICIFITHPLGPPLLKIEGDNHPAQIPILLVREEVRG